MAYGSRYGAGCELLFIKIYRLEAFFHHAKAVVRVVYGEAFGNTYFFAVPAQNTHAHTVECGSENIRRLRSELRHKAVFKLIGGLVGKRDGKNVPWTNAALYKPLNPCYEHRCFAGARSREHEHGSVLMNNRLHLACIKIIRK